MPLPKRVLKFSEDHYPFRQLIRECLVNAGIKASRQRSGQGLESSRAEALDLSRLHLTAAAKNWLNQSGTCLYHPSS
jgi:hypothetical protein